MGVTKKFFDSPEATKVSLMIIVGFVLALVVGGPLLAATGAKFAGSVLGGVGLATGFLLKDKILEHGTKWKSVIENNMEEGRPWFTNDAREIKKSWRANPRDFQDKDYENIGHMIDPRSAAM